MYLKRLELAGFKSFADRTVMEFGPGIAAVVGPNGSGKSNIADALRWVLGEHSGRQLRAARTEDLIFGGSQGRRAHGLAEVLLTLDNSGGTFPSEFREIVLGRRADRSGESDYTLNRSPCRLRDVQELLYDTGLGRHAYSLVGQGRVEEILSARASERRSLLEEAAGIVRFKARKQEALRRLEQVEHRSVRLQDIVMELADRLGPLSVEAGRARRHRQLSEEIDALETQIHLHRLRGLERRLRRRQRLARRARERLTQLRRDVEGRERTLETARSQAQDAEQRLEQAREAAATCSQRLEELRARRRVVAERQQHLEARRDHLQGEQRRVRQELERRQQDDEGDRERLQEQEARERQLQQRRKELQEEAAALEVRYRQAGEEAEAARAEADDWVERADAARNQRAGVEAERTTVAGARKRLDARVREGEAAALEQRRRLEQLEEHLKRARARGQELAGVRERATAARRRLEQQVEQADARCRRLQEGAADARTGVRALVELQQAYEGFYAGVRAALRGRDRGDPAFAGVVGVFAELISTDRRHAAAIEAALGAGLQYVVTRTAAGARRAVEALRAREQGRATFLPLDDLHPSPRERGDAPRVEGVLAPAVELVRFPDEARGAVVHLLGDVLVVRDLAAANRAARADGRRWRAVTPGGDLVHHGGAVSGGSRSERDGGLLNRRQELDEARERLQVRERELEQARSGAERTREALAKAAHQEERARSEAADAGRAAEEARRERDAAAVQAERAQSELESLAAEGQELQRRSEGLEERLERLAEEGATHSRRAQEARSRANELAGRLEDLRGRAARAREDLAQAGASLEATREQLESLRRWEKRAREERETLRRRRDDLDADHDRVQQEIAACRDERRELSRSEGRTAAERDRAQQELSTLRSEREQQAAAAADAERELTALRQQLDGEAERAHERELEAERLRVEHGQLREVLGERYGVEVPSPEQARESRGVRGYTRREIEAAAERAREARQELEELGPVNPGAEREYAAVRQRHAFLHGQMDDLVTARRRLQALVEDLDGRMDQLFRATFRQLSARFREVFSRLFGGGHADLVLEHDPDAPDQGQEAGVEIVAQPPGKRLQPLSLLSGGERALTAIALLFALLEVKPPPFCVIDEIDVALDEANLNRFVEHLRELSRRIQFVVITHQKPTIAAADTVYGVTLDEAGSSRLVAVRLDQVAAAGS